jgi:hypothetical protein
MGDISVVMKAAGAILLGPPLAWAGYTFLRDAELEAYVGVPLLLRSLACGLVYALLWGIFIFLGGRFFGDDFDKGLEIWQMRVFSLRLVLRGDDPAAFSGRSDGNTGAGRRDLIAKADRC